MDIGSIGKVAAVTPAWADASRALPATASQGVATDLAPRDAVVQSTATRSTGSDSRRPEPAASEPLDRRIVIDAATRQVVFQSVDGFTGQVVTQAPDQALLRQRAYVIQVEDARAAAAQEGATSPVERRV